MTYKRAHMRPFVSLQEVVSLPRLPGSPVVEEVAENIRRFQTGDRKNRVY